MNLRHAMSSAGVAAPLELTFESRGSVWSLPLDCRSRGARWMGMGAGQASETHYLRRISSRAAATSNDAQQAVANAWPFGGNPAWMILRALESRNSTAGTKSASTVASTATS
jgi:hypothetical protein